MSEAAKKTERRGGARVGAGTKPAGYVKPSEAVDFDKAKARKEASLADMHELNYQIKLGNYIAREPVREASATAVSTFSQSLRSLADNLERKYSLSPEVTEAIERDIDAALNELADRLYALSASPVLVEDPL